MLAQVDSAYEAIKYAANKIHDPAQEYVISIELGCTWYVILYPTETEDECIVINVGIKTMQKVNALFSSRDPLNG